jgi:hypothetical protein
MSAPLLIYTFHCLRGKRRVSAALREMTCYLMQVPRSHSRVAHGQVRPPTCRWHSLVEVTPFAAQERLYNRKSKP